MTAPASAPRSADDFCAVRPPSIEVIATGPSATIQDGGRPGLAEFGVGHSGAADRPSLRLANRLVGNPERHAAIEITFGGLWVRFTRSAVIAFTGAPCPLRIISSHASAAASKAAGMYSPIYIHAGDELQVAAPSHGLRTYLAVCGGIEIPPVLGSRSTDTLAGLGPAPLEPGCVLPIGDRMLEYPMIDLAPQSTLPTLPVLRVLPGPRDSWFAEGALDALCDPTGYEVTAQSNRVGMRLTGPKLHHREVRELPTEATVAGALQVPPAGEPILFLADHPVTGGYPVIAVVYPEDLPLAAQARPGQRVRFVLARSRWSHSSHHKTPRRPRRVDKHAEESEIQS